MLDRSFECRALLEKKLPEIKEQHGIVEEEDITNPDP